MLDATVQLQLPFLLLAVGSLLAVALGWPRRHATLVDGAVVLAAVLLAAWPILDDPFESDTLPLRVALARHAPLADWNHPPLSYLLNLPARWSWDPVVVRLAPLSWACAQALLAWTLARREGGRAAGLLAGLWLAAELRRRMGVQDLGDWDLAGCFVLGTLLWLHGRRPDPADARGRAFELAGLLGLGIAASWLAVVPAAVVAGVLLMRRRTDGVHAVELAAALGVLALAALPLLRVVRAGVGVRALAVDVPPTGLVDLALQSPAGRAPLMGLPLLLGLGWLVTRRREAWALAALGMTVAVPAAVWAAARTTHVNGAYYADLVVPVALVAAAIGTARTGSWLLARLPAWFHERARAAALVLAALTLLLPPAPNAADRSPLVTALPELARQLEAEEGAVLTDLPGLPVLLAHARAVQGLGTSEDVAAMGTLSDLATRVRQVRCADCLADAACVDAAAPGWVVFGRLARPDATRTCALAWLDRCTPLLPPGDDPDVVVARCAPPTSGSPPASRDGSRSSPAPGSPAPPSPTPPGSPPPGAPPGPTEDGRTR
ncbi:MAG: hypothetical protein H6732_14775 [Alphaproteobacteria bacterium]|nr:hypothetical protein [Alphaproteobacteria bacterium]